uniref:Uncharacterized protein n=1 Tax=Lygus hesperus TaxID=30085 RepID=A0A146M2W3_LYGHE
MRQIYIVKKLQLDRDELVEKNTVAIEQVKNLQRQVDHLHRMYNTTLDNLRCSSKVLNSHSTLLRTIMIKLQQLPPAPQGAQVDEVISLVQQCIDGSGSTDDTEGGGSSNSGTDIHTTTDHDTKECEKNNLIQ